jgi:hypothetical protein
MTGGATVHRSVSCPKCGRALKADGEVAVDLQTVPVYVCPECVTRWSFLGRTMEMPLTFIVRADGRAVDPYDPEGGFDLRPYE